MTALSLSEAAAATGLNKTTVLVPSSPARSAALGTRSGNGDSMQLNCIEFIPPLRTQPLQRPIARF